MVLAEILLDEIPPCSCNEENHTHIWCTSATHWQFVALLVIHQSATFNFVQFGHVTCYLYILDDQMMCFISLSLKNQHTDVLFNPLLVFTTLNLMCGINNIDALKQVLSWQTTADKISAVQNVYNTFFIKFTFPQTAPSVCSVRLHAHPPVLTSPSIGLSFWWLKCYVVLHVLLLFMLNMNRAEVQSCNVKFFMWWV